MKREFYFLMAFFVWVTSSCVEEYNLPTQTADYYQEEIVIQGNILAGDTSVFYVSHTTPFGNNEPAKTITDAQIYIVGENGYKSELAKYDQSKKGYTINTRELPNNTLYALTTIANGETFQSEFLELQSSPPIKDISYKERTDGISLHVSANGNESTSPYYMWTFEEDWEFHAETNILHWGGVPIYSEKFYQFENKYDNPYYYCWKHNTSKNIFIYSTKELKENTVKDVELFRIPIDDIRISYIYSILLKQITLSEEAYNYYSIMEKQTENTGGLFSPMPTEIQGNIKCITNNNKKVRGYVIASQVTSKRIFIYESDFKQIKSEYSVCKVQRPQPETLGWVSYWEYLIRNEGYVAYTKHGEIADTESLLYSNYCVDCRTVEGATKKRPDFWPNNHE